MTRAVEKYDGLIILAGAETSTWQCVTLAIDKRVDNR
jgi:hypothetical protein